MGKDCWYNKGKGKGKGKVGQGKGKGSKGKGKGKSKGKINAVDGQTSDDRSWQPDWSGTDWNASGNSQWDAITWQSGAWETVPENNVPVLVTGVNHLDCTDRSWQPDRQMLDQVEINAVSDYKWKDWTGAE